MPLRRRFPRLLPLLLLAALPPAVPALAQLPAVDAELAVVNADTLRLSDLQAELARMQAVRPKDAPLKLPAAEDVLRRLIQNQLLAQEGYRLGYERDPDVRAQVEESIRSSTIDALLDSVVLSVPDGTPDRDARRKAAVEGFTAATRRRLGARADAALLASLDYATADTSAQQALRRREEMVASVGDARLTVKALTRRIRFTFFHGLQGRADADSIRDSFVEEWLDEMALAREARDRGYRNRPAVRIAARRLEEDLVREAALRTLLSFTFKPADREVEAWYKGHPELFTPEPRVKVESAMFADSTAAFRFRDRLRQGAKFRWLVGRTAEVTKDVQPFPADWLPPAALGLRKEDVARDRVLEPYGVPGGWAVAQIVDVEKPAPAPLAESKGRAATLMKNERAREIVAEALRRLESAAVIRTTPDALGLIRGTLSALEGGQS